MRFLISVIVFLIPSLLLGQSGQSGDEQKSGSAELSAFDARYGILGQQAPDWSIKEWVQISKAAVEKGGLNISDYRGKVLLLYCFQSWCPGCHSRGFPTLQKIQKRMKGDGDFAMVVVQTVFEGKDINTFDKLLPTAQKYKLVCPFGQSERVRDGTSIMERYRTGGTPWFVLIDKNGVVRANGYNMEVDKGVAAIRALASESTVNHP